MTFAEIGRYADLSVMFPAAVVIALWLLFGRSPRATLTWLAVLGSSYALVAASKLAFKGWGTGIRSLDFTVISGQSMNATLMLSVLLSLLARQLRPSLLWPGALAGLAIGGWFALFQIRSHPLSEACAGYLLGALAACIFLFRLERLDLVKLHPLPIALGIGLIGYAATLPRWPVEVWLDHIATFISGNEEVFTPWGWRQ